MTMPTMPTMTIIDLDAQKAISDNTGIPFDRLIDMDWDEIDDRIERKNGKSLSFHPCNDSRLPVRGSVFLSLGRLIFKQDIQRRIDSIGPFEDDR